MAKTKDRQYNGQNTNEGQTIQWPKQKGKTESGKPRTDNTMTKTQTKDRQYKGQNTNERQIIQWPKHKRRTDNTMAKTKRKNF
jgi:hypothetical protein